MSLLLQILAPELIEMILDTFCEHLAQINCRICSSPRCTCHGDEARKFIDKALPSTYALASLNRTCKHLRQATTWRLYYCPVTRGPQQSWYLARTILTRPELAQLVKFLLVEGGRRPSLQYEKEEIPSEMMQYYRERIAAFDDKYTYLRYIHVPITYSVGKRLAKFGQGVPVDLITSLCPNVENLEYSLPNESYYNAGFLEPGIMFWPGHTSTNTVKNIIIRSGDYWICRDEEMELLLRWAPKLEGIFLSCFHTGIMGRTYENDVRDKSTLQLNFVKVLKIKESRLMEGDLSRLLSLCPNLEEFVYELDIEELEVSGTAEPYVLTLSPMHAARVVHNHLHVKGGRLKRFVVDLTCTVDRLYEYLSAANHGDTYWNHSNMPPSDYYNFVDEESNEILKATEMLAKLGVEFLCDLEV